MNYNNCGLRRFKANCYHYFYFISLFVYIVLFAQLIPETKADPQTFDSSRSSPPIEVRRAESQLRSGYNVSDVRRDGRTRPPDPLKPIEYIYKTLNERGLIKMCSLMQKADQQELNKLLGQNFTLLAPSDEAFGLMPGSQYEELISDPTKRNEFIKQHIIPDRLMLNTFRAFDERELKNANGLTQHITAYPNGFVVNGANVVDGDIQIPRSNNLIQVVDKVLYPQKSQNLLEVLEDNPHLTQISSFLALSGLDKELKGNDSFTFFAPNDEAFRAVPWPVTQQMLSNNTFLRLLLANHVIPGKQYATGLSGHKLYSIGGNVLNFTTKTVQSHTLVLVNLVPIIDNDMIANNGVIHVITRIILPKELMDDCKCWPMITTTTPLNDTTPASLENGSTTTLDPFKDMFNMDEDLNKIDRRYGLAPPPPPSRTPNGDHFTSTPKPISFKTFWDDIFATTGDTSNTTTNGTQTPAANQTTVPTSTTTLSPNITEFPLLWDFLTTELPEAANQTRDQRLNDSYRNQRQYTPGVVYLDELNITTTTSNGSVINETTTAAPMTWTRAFYRPERRRNFTETGADNTTDITTQSTTVSAFYRPTLKPTLRPTNRRHTFTAQPNIESNVTYAPYDRRYGILRDRPSINETDDGFGRRNLRIQEPIQQIRDEEQYVEQEIEPQNRTQYPYHRDSNIISQSDDRPKQPPYGRQDSAQPFVRKPYDGNRNDSSQESPEIVQQKAESPTTWTHQQNVSHVSPTRQQTSPQRYPQQPNRGRQNWWDSRYDSDAYPMRAYVPPSKTQTRHQTPYDQSKPFQSAHSRPRDYRPGVVYSEEPQYYRPPDQSSRPYYRPLNDTKSVTGYRPQQPFDPKRGQYPTSDVYLKPELVDRSYVPAYNPYRQPAPPMIVGEYPFQSFPSFDHPYHPMGQFRPMMREPITRGHRVDPYDRRSGIKSIYDTIRRSGDSRPSSPSDDKQSPKSADLKTVSEIMDSPDLMVGGKFKTFDKLKEFIKNSGLWETLNRPTTFITMFMPTDDAFDAITDGSVDEMKRNPKLVRDFLTQHLLGYSLQPQNVRNNMRVKSLNGEMHLINVIDGGKILIDGNEVIAATTAKNGNIYVMDKVLEKAGRRSRSIVDELKKRPELSAFSNLLQRSDRFKQLTQEMGPFTVMAPTNEALNNANIRDIIKNQNDLNEFMKKHVMDGAVYSQQLSDSSDPQDYRDIRRIGLSSDSSISINNETKVLSPDITTENGVIHVIDGILPEKLNITEKRPQNTGGGEESQRNAKQTSMSRSAQSLGIRRFTNWLNKSGVLDEVIRDGRQYTVIVPTDRAVGKLPLKIQSILNSEPTRLTSLLEYHIIPGFVDTRTLKDNELLTTINNKQIRFNRLDNGRVQLFSGAPVNRQSTDQNLLIIAVDNVLYPPQGTVIELVAKSPLLKTLNEIIKTANMTEELTNSTDITLFAPKDEALKRLEPEVLERLKTDQNYSREFLRKHLISKVLFTTALQVSNESNITHKEQAMSGETLKIYRKPNCVSVNGIILSFADITATNGVLHIVDHVI
ncbi:uncharacterized protein LOC128961320 [Oppia nitens]|uniref:uncharacterized protein LOC128961320 n=1 Tax=Oppia nitens TaxID=1686743 RepID=UPI0023D9C92D|nr:uncharacterized protein LOC128961320 [Oppia nitens]